MCIHQTHLPSNSILSQKLCNETSSDSLNGNPQPSSRCTTPQRPHVDAATATALSNRVQLVSMEMRLNVVSALCTRKMSMRQSTLSAMLAPLFHRPTSGYIPSFRALGERTSISTNGKSDGTLVVYRRRLCVWSCGCTRVLAKRCPYTSVHNASVPPHLSSSTDVRVDCFLGFQFSWVLSQQKRKKQMAKLQPFILQSAWTCAECWFSSHFGTLQFGERVVLCASVVHRYLVTNCVNRMFGIFLLSALLCARHVQCAPRCSDQSPSFGYTRTHCGASFMLAGAAT